MGVFTRGFKGKRRRDDRLPPGQYLVDDFPVLSAGPTPRLDLDRWRFELVTEHGEGMRWTWAQLMELPAEDITVDIHCVTRWSKLATRWRGVSFDRLLSTARTEARFAMVNSYGGYTTNVPLSDLRDNQAWIAFQYDGEPLAPEHGGPARMLIPHLYLWKSAKWVKGVTLTQRDRPGFWESLGYHNQGDPWSEQRYSRD
jgi:DMSO/TMAO reductase YedYZ molybdopterin-dependent catalytic subunit